MICILTIIKNEHPYLDEWISYHLDMGIHHIFIFEDIDSDSHKQITDKYGDKVTLQSISSILEEDEINKALEYKITKEKSAQQIYGLKALLYIKNNFNYEWCALIDNDEFLTPEHSDDKLEDVLNQYNAYDALILSWKIYGANGLIHTPDYSNKGVIETYSNPSSGIVPLIHPSYNKKTIFHLNRFNEEFWWAIHCPNEKCNYCNTNFVKNNSDTVYHNLYIRHYITKSWDEYVWKKKCRGYYMGFARTFNAFFSINPELNYMKETLLSELDDEVLVVLTYSSTGAQGNEIRIALSGWKKFCKSKYHFVLIGDYDKSLCDEFDWVDFIYEPVVFKKEGQYNPHIDIQHKMEIAYNLFKDKYPGFIWMVDDNYAIKPFYTFDIKSIHFHTLNFKGNENSPTYYWTHDKWKTRQLLDKENLPHINYTTHFPCYFEFDRIKNIWDKYDLRNNSYVVEDIYFNSFIHIKPSLDSNIRFGIWDKIKNNQNINLVCKNPNIKFVCNSTEGWSSELESELNKIINE